jgi:hypothetical protein
MKRLLGISAFSIVFLLACGDDPTGPTGPFALTLTNELRSAIIDFTDDQPYLCEYKAIAQTEGGESGEFADWLGGRLDWLEGDSTIFSYSLSVDDLLDRFGDVTIGRNKKQNFIRSAAGSDPYDLRLVVSARHSSGDVLTDSTTVGCEFPPDVMDPGNLAGSWEATWVKWESPDAVVWQYELISADGALSFNLSENGSFSGSTTYPFIPGGMAAQNVSGTLAVTDSESVTSGTATLTFAAGPYGTVTGTLLRIKDELFFEGVAAGLPGGASFDFNRDGTPDAAQLVARFKLK